jgi:hypothetical protein
VLHETILKGIAIIKQQQQKFLNLFSVSQWQFQKLTRKYVCALIRNETSLNYSPLPKVLGPFSAYG